MDPGYRRRTISICFTQDDEPTEKERTEFEKLMRERVSKELKTLRDFAVNYILGNQKKFLLAYSVTDWKENSKTVLADL